MPAGRPCCCPDICVYYPEYPGKEYLSGDFDQRTGVWTINDESIVTTSSDGLLQCLTENDEDVHVVQAELKSTVVGDKIGILTNYRTDSDYWYVELECKNPSSFLRLFEVEGGFSTQRGDTYILNGVDLSVLPVFIEVVFGYRGVCVNYLGTTVIDFRTGKLTDSWAGLITKNLTGTATFTNFKLLYHETQNDRCPGCELAFEPPDCLKLDLSGFVEGAGCFEVPCTCYNGTYYLEGAYPTEVFSADFNVYWVREQIDQWCNNWNIYADYYKSGTDYLLRVRANRLFPNGYAVFEENLGNDINAVSNLASESLSLIDNSGACDASAAVCLVTAVDGHVCPPPERVCQACSECGDTRVDEYSMVMNGWNNILPFVSLHPLNGIEFIASPAASNQVLLDPCAWNTPPYNFHDALHFASLTMAFLYEHLAGGGTTVTIRYIFNLVDGTGVNRTSHDEVVNGPINCSTFFQNKVVVIPGIQPGVTITINSINP